MQYYHRPRFEVDLVCILSIICHVTDSRQFSMDSAQGGLEILCILTASLSLITAGLLCVGSGQNCQNFVSYAGT